MPKNYVSRTSRIEAYEQMEGPAGASRDMRNIDHWVGRASENSQLAPRASDGAMKLPATKMALRNTDQAPRASRNADRAMVDKEASPDVRRLALGDRNDVGSSFMRGVRRGV